MTSSALIQSRRRSLLWRLHFWSALIASPFVLVACLTGLLYVFTPQIERSLHGHLDTVQPQAQAKTLDEVVLVARQAAPEGWSLHSVVPAFDADDSVRVVFTPPMQDKPRLGGMAVMEAMAALVPVPVLLKPSRSFCGPTLASRPVLWLSM